MAELALENWIFEPHGGFGGVDPDGEPWPFGYISARPGQPIFELSTVLTNKPSRPEFEALLTAARKMTAAAWMHSALLSIVDALEDNDVSEALTVARVAIAKSLPVDASQPSQFGVGS